MRRHRSSLRLTGFLFCVLFVAPISLSAQNGVGVESAYLLLPIGARALGVGQAVVAGGGGSESIGWNPALIARAPREAAFNLAQQATGVIETDASGGLVWPVPRLGAVALTLRYIGELPQSSSLTGDEAGKFSITGIIASGTFAATFGKRASAGVTLKFLQLGSHCTGSCDLPPFPPRTAAIDLGAQYLVTRDSMVTIGASALNLGFPLQVNDSPQADPLPSRLDVGVSVVPRLSSFSADIHARLEADLVQPTSGGDAGFRFGAEVSWQQAYVVRAGYQLDAPTGTGPTVGVGLATGKLRIDFAQVLTDLGVGLGKPTFLSLRYLF
jgi:hypothetical protein